MKSAVKNRGEKYDGIGVNVVQRRCTDLVGGCNVDAQGRMLDIASI